LGESRRQIPWLRIGVEGVTIVVSILLAFSIDAGWNLSREGAEEEEILLGLDLEFDDLRSRLDLYAEYNRTGARLVDQLLSDSIHTLSRASADSALTHATVVNVLDQGGTLDALMASGRLEMIRDREIRSRLAKWPDWLEDIHTNDLSFRDFAWRELAPTLAAWGWPAASCSFVLFYNECDQGPVPQSYVTLLRDPHVRALLITRRLMMVGSARDHESASLEASELLELIRARGFP
jgi:hypothetical protein